MSLTKSLKSIFQGYNPENIPALEYPSGSVSMQGNSYAITTSNYSQEAPLLAKQVKLSVLIAEADVWLKVGNALCSYLVLLLLFFEVSILTTILSTVAFWLLWEFQKSAFYMPSLSQVAYWLANDLVWFIVCGFGLSILGNTYGLNVFLIGIAVLFLLKIGLFSKLLNHIYGKAKGHTLNDRLIRMVVIKQSIYYGLPHPKYATMQQNWVDRMQKLNSIGKPK